MAKHSLQTNSKNYPDCWAKPCRDILLKPFCFVFYRYPNLYDIIAFDMSCFHCCMVYCFFETCKVKSVLKLYFRGGSQAIVLHSTLPIFSAIPWTN